ncbi:putative coronin [Trypanosoma cruzi]|uniref:Coronin n=2 Tax=Trypanosoma cruzi TaxID=5693 RepID=Q4DEX0_TRYCC|nr:coronin, putative [Trypanosoma cruzi]EAN91075.1 coronin, putative [Trypanosoma cruzi]PWV12244.1 putative coronin [Trypanosoma cruzi]RNC58334.1 putative coronin [Trypanosoma cruzi]|eukprot:XP_812926.1 coronin [Trypanosoma cruzi strain CL Brener]
MAISRFRHTQSVPARHDRHFMNVNPSGAIWDCSNMIACNDRFLAVPWAQLGSTAVLRHTDYGKVPSSPPILLGQEGPVIDVAFNPFDPTKLFTASEDGTIMGWDIPEEGLTQSTSDHIVHLQGHTKKVGIVNFHPSAMNVLASAGADMVVNVWDVNTGKAGEVLKCHTDQIMSLEWNLDGSLLCSTSKDKKVNIMDPRRGDIVASGSAHQGGKSQRCVWAKRQNLIVTVGFSKAQSRQVMLWDARDMASPVHTEDIDQFSSLILPFFDEDTNILYIGGKGDGIIRFFELVDGRLVPCSSYDSVEAHKGLCMFPKWSLDTRQCEIARFYALTPRSIYPIQMLLPRRLADSELQVDVYPPTFADVPAITAEAYFSGGNSEPLVTDMHAVFNGTEREVMRAVALTPSGKKRHQGVTSAMTHSFDTNSSKYTDPMTMGVEYTEKRRDEGILDERLGKLAALALELQKQEEDLKRCQEEVEKKRRIVMETVEKIRDIAFGHAL